MSLMPTNTKDPFIYGQNWSLGIPMEELLPFRSSERWWWKLRSRYLCTLQNLRSKIIGGPTSIICPPISVVNNPSVSRRTTSRTPTVSPSRDFCEVVRLLKMKPSLYQDDFNIKPAIFWIHTSYKADFFWGCFLRILLGPNIVTFFPLNFLLAFPFSIYWFFKGIFHVALFINLNHTNMGWQLSTKPAIFLLGWEW